MSASEPAHTARLFRRTVLSKAGLFANFAGGSPSAKISIKESLMKRRILLFALMIFAISTVTAISFAQRTRDTAEKPITGDFKITIKNTVSGQNYQSTTMIKGKRERSESSTGGMSTGSVSITQCDLRRTIQINDSSRKYLITAMESDAGDVDAGGAGISTSATTGGPTKRGGVVTMT